ncbi:hypothetical protein J8I87_05475 [Paraburkholderia sp. LEh10]|uniref:hypothetical protein n=1 Tax=Paraburkholderia sp. LEh10 TaxID=2821353 RepID=UPI001AEB9E8F|nr:hypothetical protein [Paraburkholderia sp. LEh10]MBP0589175.1 hypothetical protein [Paraburkholderia sp. LEh10]
MLHINNAVALLPESVDEYIGQDKARERRMRGFGHPKRTQASDDPPGKRESYLVPQFQRLDSTLDRGHLFTLATLPLPSLLSLVFRYPAILLAARLGFDVRSRSAKFVQDNVNAETIDEKIVYAERWEGLRPTPELMMAHRPQGAASKGNRTWLKPLQFPRGISLGHHHRATPNRSRQRTAAFT